MILRVNNFLLTNLERCEVLTIDLNKTFCNPCKNTPPQVSKRGQDEQTTLPVKLSSQKCSGNNQYSDTDTTEWLATNRSARILTFVARK